MSAGEGGGGGSAGKQGRWGRRGVACRRDGVCCGGLQWGSAGEVGVCRGGGGLQGRGGGGGVCHYIELGTICCMVIQKHIHLQFLYIRHARVGSSTALSMQWHYSTPPNSPSV